jgi:uncharacterized membrane protein SpoIIM required for sporulation
MRETKFIDQNKEKWEELEETMESRYYQPEKLLQLFVQILDDLSFSRTFYPNRSVRVYLNSLAQKIFFTIYKNRKSPFKRFSSFWIEELPQLVYESRKEFLLSFLIFAFSSLIGVLSTQMDPDFPTLILGEDYINMTLENIDSGDPMAVYKAKGAFGMSLGITINNLFVAFLTFALGATYLGAIIILVRNGIMVGVFQYFFIQKGLFYESFLTIWIHGTLEISAIIIAGAAGLTMGKGLVFPGTFRRIQAFQKSARRGLKIMVGIFPIFVAAGFIEGYLTRHTELPNEIRFIFIVLCLLFVLAYFIAYPFYKASKGFKNALAETRIPPDKNEDIDFHLVKNTGILFTDIFTFFRKYQKKILLLVLVSATTYVVTIFLVTANQLPSETFFFAGISSVFADSLGQFFYGKTHKAIPIVSICSMSISIFFLYKWMRKESKIHHQKFKSASDFLKVFFGVIIMHLLLMTNVWMEDGWRSSLGSVFYNFLVMGIAGPILLLWLYTMFVEGKNPFKAFGRAFRLIRFRYSTVFSLFTTLFIVGYIFILILDSYLLTLFLELVAWVIHLEQEQMDELSIVLLSFVSLFVFYLVLSLIIIGAGLLYYSLLEIAETNELRRRIDQIGQSQKIKGLERETSN